MIDYKNTDDIDLETGMVLETENGLGVIVIINNVTLVKFSNGLLVSIDGVHNNLRKIRQGKFEIIYSLHQLKRASNIFNTVINKNQLKTLWVNKLGG